MSDYPLIKFVTAFIFGLILSSFLEVSLEILIALFIIFLISSIILFFFKNSTANIFSTASIFIAVILIGLIYISADKISEPTYLFEDKFIKNVLVDGRVEQIELPGKKLVLNVNVDKTIKGNSIVEHQYNIICNLSYDEEIIHKILGKLSPGNRIVVLGNLLIPPNQKNPGEFDYREYLKGKNISAMFNSYSPMDFVIVDYEKNLLTSLIFDARYAVALKLKELYSEKTAGLLKGLLLADRSEIGYDIKEGFVKSGVIHVLAVSGLHVGFIVLILVFLLGRFNIYLRITFTIIGLLAFMIITGLPPSVTRATIMAVLLLISYLRSNKQNNFNTLALAAFIILIFDPTQIFNPGFQLSFSAVFSIFVFYPKISKVINDRNITNKLLRYVLLFVGLSLAAQIGTIPFTIYYFEKLSLISLAANLFVIPMIGIILGWGIVTIIIGSFSLELAYLISLTNEFIVEMLFSIVNFLSLLSISHLSLPNYSIWDGAVYLILLTVFTIYFRKLITLTAKSIFVILIAANLLVWSNVDNKKLMPDGKLSVLFVDVGNSESAIIKFPNKKTAVVNFGGGSDNYNAGDAVLIPLLNRLGIDKINYGIISHLNRNKYLGIIPFIENNLIDTLFIPNVYGSDIELELFLNYLNDKKIILQYINKIKIIAGNSKIYLLDELLKSEYAYFNPMNRSTPVKLQYGKNSILLMAGIEKRGEALLLENKNAFLKSDVIQIANYGSNISTSNELLQEVNPLYSIINVGLGNFMEYPSEEVLGLISQNNIKLFRTDNDGAILFISDGDKIEFVDWRMM
ncbi:hypothetical protein ASZ90_004052 [hydrocarbon metagenome]|uniref:Uncharacterized protein n=1 Tax=hydrocarbon metagenome TaxID=938273 RepID=A0A0W8FZ52_9ZZZZ